MKIAIYGKELTNVTGNAVHYFGCILKNCTLTDCDFDDCKLINCTINGEVKLVQSSFTDCGFTATCKTAKKSSFSGCHGYVAIDGWVSYCRFDGTNRFSSIKLTDNAMVRYRTIEVHYDGPKQN